MTPMWPKLTEAENLLGGTLPHSRMEAWKWTDVRTHLSKPQNGLTSACVPNFIVPEGMTVRRGEIPPGEGVMSTLADNFAGEGFIINVPDGFTARDPLLICDLSVGHARILVQLGKGAGVSVIELYDSKGSGFANTEINFDLSECAKLKRIVLQTDHAEFTRITTSHISSRVRADYTQYVLSFGAGLSRHETRLTAMGSQVNACLHGAYLLSGQRHCDMTSCVDLAAPATTVRQSVKGVVTDRARGVFQGKFHVRRQGQHTGAEMCHDALMLSDTSEIRARPELEIYADDVACTHGNTIGALDKNVLFYVRQRGIPLSEARALLIQAFVEQGFDGLDENTREDFLIRVRTWLEGHA